MQFLKLFSRRKSLSLSLTRGQKELLEFFILHKIELEKWMLAHPQPKIRFQFYYPTAVDFFYSDFKLFSAYFKKNNLGEIELTEVKISETNFDSIRCYSWAPFEDVIMKFITSLEESKKVALFEKRKLLFEYESLCNKQPQAETSPKEYFNSMPALVAR